MRILLTLIAKDFANLRRNRAALILSFAVPMMVIYIVGLVFGLGRKDSGPTGIPLAVVNQSSAPEAAQLVAALRAEPSFRVVTEYERPDHSTRPLREEDLRPMIRDRKFSYALVLPADLVSDSRLGLHLKVLSDPRNDIENQIVSGLMQKTIFSNVPQLLGQSLQARARNLLGTEKLDDFNRALAQNIASNFGGDAGRILTNLKSGNFGLDRLFGSATGSGAGPGGSGGSGAGDVFSRIVSLEQEQVVGKEVKNPAATRIVGGYAVMFLLFALSNSAAAFFEEKNAGLFQRLLASPVTRGQLLWSRFLYGVLFGLMQLMALFLAGHFLYGVDVFGHWWLLSLTCAAVAAACTALGMLLAAATSSGEAARSLGSLIVITMSALGGAWFPVSFMPEFMQRLAHFTIVYWAIEGFGGVLWADESLGELLPVLGILAGTAAVLMALAVWRFNRSRIFD